MLLRQREENDGSTRDVQPLGRGTYRCTRQREEREGWQAALLCHGIAQAVLGQPMSFALYEDADYDCIFSWQSGPNPRYAPVQLKEVVPDSVNPEASIEQVLAKLTRYTTSDNLIVGIHLNRAGIADLGRIRPPHLNVRELWIYGAIDDEQTRWALFGNMLDRPRLYVFDYPTPENGFRLRAPIFLGHEIPEA